MFDSKPPEGPPGEAGERPEWARILTEREERLGALEAEAVELSGVIAAATGKLLGVIARWDEVYSGATTAAGNPETRDWVAWACGTDKRNASRYLRLAHRLKGLPRMAEKLTSGGITFDKVDALSRIASKDNEEVLLEWAAHGTAQQLRTLAAGYLRSVEADEDAFARRAARSVTYHFDDFGDLNLRARLPGEDGAIVTRALEDALARLREDAAGGPEKDVRPGAERADALVAVADRYLGAETAERSGSERYQVTVTTERDPATGEPFDTRLPGDVPLPAETALRLTCDCSAVEVTTSGGRPLDVGRKSRRPTTALRRALAARDRGCRFPGCSRRAHLDAHHIEHWIKGGPTRLTNLILLCRGHHRLVHEGGYQIALDDSGAVTFRSRTGEVVPDAPPICEMTLAESDAAAQLLYATPAEPHWVDPLDLDLAVYVLHQLKRRRAPT